MNATDRQHFAPLFHNNHNLREQDFHHPDQRDTMALRNYMLNLVSDLAESNETSMAKMSVTIVSDNTIPSVRSDEAIAPTGSLDSTLEVVSPKPSVMPLGAKGTPGFGRTGFGSRFKNRRLRRRFDECHPDFYLAAPEPNNSKQSTTSMQ